MRKREVGRGTLPRWREQNAPVPLSKRVDWQPRLIHGHRAIGGVRAVTAASVGGGGGSGVSAITTTTMLMMMMMMMLMMVVVVVVVVVSGSVCRIGASIVRCAVGCIAAAAAAVTVTVVVVAVVVVVVTVGMGNTCTAPRCRRRLAMMG